MSLVLSSTPDATEAQTDFDGRFVTIGDATMSTADFCALAIYVLTNTDLRTADPRLHLIRQIANMEVVDGFNNGNKRLSFRHDPEKTQMVFP